MIMCCFTCNNLNNNLKNLLQRVTEVDLLHFCEQNTNICTQGVHPEIRD